MIDSPYKAIVPDTYEGINPQKLPKIWYKHYVVYKYDYCDTEYISGYDDVYQAVAITIDLQRNPMVQISSIQTFFPRRLLE